MAITPLKRHFPDLDFLKLSDVIEGKEYIYYSVLHFQSEFFDNKFDESNFVFKVKAGKIIIGRHTNHIKLSEPWLDPPEEAIKDLRDYNVTWALRNIS